MTKTKTINWQKLKKYQTNLDFLNPYGGKPNTKIFIRLTDVEFDFTFSEIKPDEYDVRRAKGYVIGKIFSFDLKDDIKNYSHSEYDSEYHFVMETIGEKLPDVISASTPSWCIRHTIWEEVEKA